MLKKDAEDYKIESREKFDKQAEKYDSGNKGKHARSLYESVLNKLDEYTFTNILDVGCGTGNLLKLISSKYDVQIAGVDLTPKMLNIAKIKLGDEADLKVSDSEELPFEDNKFDMVICTDSFHHYPHPEKVLAEIGRVLENNGMLLIADPTVPAPLRQLVNLYFKLSRSGDVKIYSESDICKLLEETGFVSLNYEHAGINAFIATAQIKKIKQ
ncbi:MAG: class I SAM-dependent methyltransferase [Methanobacterium sp.]|uniref:class I SAM-dependent methyltransferase n=1 Tax=Methanobacterium sp. TaxID=2164 RepID=UPI003C754DF5